MINSSYLKFLVATEKIFAQFSALEKQVLKAIFARGTEDPFRVLDILQMKTIASQATLHKTLSTLIKNRYLMLKPSKEDGRIKHVVMSKKLIKLLEEINTHLKKSVD